MNIERLKRIIRVIVNQTNGQVKVQDDNTGVQYDVAYLTMSDPAGVEDLVIHIRPDQPIPQPPYDLPLQKGTKARD